VRGTGDGAVLYTDSTLALNADTGKIVWHHQFLPRDNWNLDHVFENGMDRPCSCPIR
jgi:alcohol dehydrogenase (cytochrome c)